MGGRGGPPAPAEPVVPAPTQALAHVAQHGNTALVPRVKVTAPRVRAFGRNRLLQALRGIAERRVALVVAPAGSGKTTLLAQFAAASSLPVAWYRAESDDADAATLVSGLGAALA